MPDKAFNIFVVEDDAWYSKLLSYHLSLDPDFQVQVFSNAKEIIKALDQQPNVITLDYRLPDMDGDEVFALIREKSPETEVVIVSEQNDIETAINLLKQGAYDYIVKSNEIGERLLTTMRNIRKNAGLKLRIKQLESEVRNKYNFENSILGRSKAIQAVYELIAKTINNSINVSISGETGTGKELVAKAVHFNSNLADKPFVAVNVSAIPKELFESELFGHEKGSFTGATSRRIGKIEQANNGTLFLDEIAELDPVFQAKLLRVLQEREITRVGSNETISINCRIITATHKNLLDEVKNGNFREDLYYRLIGLPIHLPPLRDREKDSLFLANHFINAFCNENKFEQKSLSEEAQMKILSYSWPGNIRELKSVAELSVVLAAGIEISGSDIMLSTSDKITQVFEEELSMREYEHKILQLFLTKYNNNIKLVAEKLELGMTTIYRMLKEMKNED